MIFVRIKWSVGSTQVYEGTLSSTGVRYFGGYTKTDIGLYMPRGVYVHTIDTVADFACFATDEQMQLEIQAAGAFSAWADRNNITLSDNNYSVTGIHVSFTGTATGAAHPLQADFGDAHARCLVKHHLLQRLINIFRACARV